MKKLLLILLTIPSLTLADVVLFDEVTEYARVGQKKGPALAASSIETCSYNNPYSGLVCIEGTNTSNSYNDGGNKFSIVFALGWIDPSEFTALVYHVRQKNIAAGRMNIHAYGSITSGVQEGMVRIGYSFSENYGLNNYNVTSYQTITVPISAFAFPSGTIVNRFTWDVVNAHSGWYIDQIVLVGSGTIHRPDPYPPAEAP